jgi:peroxiredoxin
MRNVPAPMFDTLDIQGKPQRLTDYRSKVVLVNIWATWCEPCRNEMPQLDKLYQSRKESGFVVLGISDETIEKQRAFLLQVPVTYPLLLTTAGVPSFYREVGQYPATFLIDREGKLQPLPRRSQGSRRWKTLWALFLVKATERNLGQRLSSDKRDYRLGVLGARCPVF